MLASFFWNILEVPLILFNFLTFSPEILMQDVYLDTQMQAVHP